jgi:transposase InsO family protein
MRQTLIAEMIPDSLWPMDWQRLLAYITGSVDRELLARNEYLAEENRILRSQIKGRLRLNDAERRNLAEIGQRLGRKALEDVAQIVRPETILAWHRKLVAQKFDGSEHRSTLGRPRLDRSVEEWVVQLARDNRTWGYKRIAGALENLGHNISRQTVANILKRHGLAPAPERGKRMLWKDFIQSHLDVLAAVDFFTAEVWTVAGLMTYYVLVFMRVGSRQIRVAGFSVAPDSEWMKQMARNLTMAGEEMLQGCRYLLHDRDAKFCTSFDEVLRSAGIEPLTLPPHSPNLNSHLERWNRSVKEECLSKIILFGEASLRYVLANYVQHFHTERNHQGKGNVILFPAAADRVGELSGAIRTRQRLGGLLKFYYREAA